MYSAIVNKQEVPDSTKMTPAYKIAQNRYSKASSFSSMTPSQVSDQMRSAKLVEWSQAFEDLKAINPKLVQDATNLRKVNGDTTNIWTTNTDGTKVNNLEKSIADDYTDNFGEFIKSMYKVYTPAEITAIIRTPDVVSAEDKAFAIEKSINELDKQIANIDSEVDTEFKWSGATGSRLAMEKASRRDVLNKDRDSQVREYTTYANRASNLITQNTTSFQTQQQQQQAQNAAMLPFIQDQYKTAQAKKQAEFELNDPATAIKSVMDEYKKLGIPFTSTVQSRLDEFKASGKPLSQFLTEMGQNIQQSPAYQNYARLQEGQLSDAQKMQMGQQYDIQKMGISNQFDLQKLAQQNNFDMNKLAVQLEANGWTKDASGNLVNPVTGQVFNGTTSSGATGNIVPVSVWNKTVRLDQSGATWFESAIGQLTAAWIPIVVWQGARDQTATIQSMANQYGIPFNASNPAETAQKLRSAWHQVADPGKSNHETGMAIDVYGSSKLDKVTPAQEKILNANGWYSANIPGDAGHFEYNGVGGTGTQGTPVSGKLGTLAQFMKDNQKTWVWYSDTDVKRFDAKIDRLASLWDEKGMAISYRDMIMSDNDFKKDFDDTKKFTTALDSVERLINDYEKSGKSTNALKWMAEKMYRSLWLTQDQALSQLQTQLGTTMANYIKSISGTAASDAEVQRLMGNMANISNVKELNNTIIKQVRDNAQSSIKSMIDTRMYGMPEELKPQVFWDIYWTSNISNTKLSSAMSILEKIIANAPK